MSRYCLAAGICMLALAVQAMAWQDEAKPTSIVKAIAEANGLLKDMDTVDENNLWMVFRESELSEDIGHPPRGIDRHGAGEPVAPLWEVVSKIGEEFDLYLHGISMDMISPFSPGFIRLTCSGFGIQRTDAGYRIPDFDCWNSSLFSSSKSKKAKRRRGRGRVRSGERAISASGIQYPAPGIWHPVSSIQSVC